MWTKVTGGQVERVISSPINITEEFIQEFVYEIAKKISPRSQARIISGLRSFFEYLIFENYRESNPTDLIEAPKTGRKLPDTLSEEEINSLITAIDLSKAEGERNRAMLETMYSCGLRVSELIHLKISDLFFEENFSLETEPVPGTLRREITGIKMGQVFIPTDRFGQVIVPYIGESQLGQAGTYPYISVVDLMNDALTEAEEAALFNSLVLVGATATGMFDLRATPLENIYPGVEVHANILNAILNSAPTFTVESTEAQTESESGLGAMISGLTSTQRDPSLPSQTGKKGR